MFHQFVLHSRRHIQIQMNVFHLKGRSLCCCVWSKYCSQSQASISHWPTFPVFRPLNETCTSSIGQNKLCGCLSSRQVFRFFRCWWWHIAFHVQSCFPFVMSQRAQSFSFSDMWQVSLQEGDAAVWRSVEVLGGNPEVQDEKQRWSEH